MFIVINNEGLGQKLCLQISEDFPENKTCSKSRGIFCAKDRFLNQKQVPAFFVFDALDST